MDLPGLFCMDHARAFLNDNPNIMGSVFKEPLQNSTQIFEINNST